MADFIIGVADDEPDIRESICFALEDEYSARFPGRTLGTVQFERASDVVDFLIDDPDQLDLLLLDVRYEHTGGGETGVDVLPEIRELRPELPVWLVTGTIRDKEVEIASGFSPIDYVEKPVSRDTLVRKMFFLLASSVVEERRAFVDSMRAIAERNRAARASSSDADSFRVPPGVDTLLRQMFPRVLVHKSALKELLSSPAAEDVLRTLHRLNNDEFTAGNRRRAYTGVVGVEEIRSSRRARIFIERCDRGWSLLAITNQHEHVGNTFSDLLNARRSAA